MRAGGVKYKHGIKNTACDLTCSWVSRLVAIVYGSFLLNSSLLSAYLSMYSAYVTVSCNNNVVF